MSSATALVFITQTGPAQNRSTQTQIRKHVMKDIGKSRRKAGHRKQLRPLQFTLNVPDHPDLADRATLEKKTTSKPRSQVKALSAVQTSKLVPPTSSQLARLNISKGDQSSLPPIDRLYTGRMDPFVKYPIEMTYRTRQLMDHIFDDRYGNTPPFRDAWMPTGLADPAAFHQVLSNASLNLASLHASDSVPETLESINLHAKAVQLVHRRIGEPKETLSDGLLGAVIGFACYHHVIGNQAGWHQHMVGVKEILRLRGGLTSINSNHLLKMILFWVDTGGATTEDILPYFFIPCGTLSPFPSLAHNLRLSSKAEGITTIWKRLYPSQIGVMNVMNDLQRFTTHLKDQVLLTNGAVFRDGDFAASFILPLQYRLLSLSTHPIVIEDEASAESQAVRLACVLYLAEIKRAFGIMGVISTFQSRKLRSFLEMGWQWEGLESLRMWCLAMGGMESQGSLRSWYLREMGKERKYMGDNWEEVGGCLKKVLWFDDVHSAMFQDLINGVETSRVGKRRGY